MVLPFSFNTRFKIWLALLPFIIIGVCIFTKGGSDTLIGIGVMLFLLFPATGTFKQRKRKAYEYETYNIYNE